MIEIWKQDRDSVKKENYTAVAGYKIVVDRKFTVVQASPEYAEMTGYSLKEVYSGQHVFKQFLSAQAFDFMRNTFKREGREGREFSFFQELLTQDKRMLQVINCGTFQQAETGERFFCGILTDISGRYKKNQDKEILLNCIDMPVVQFLPDQAGSLVYCNRAFLDLTGYAAEEVAASLGNSVKALFCEDDHAWLFGDDESSFDGERTRNVRIVHKEKMPVTVTLTKKCMINGMGALNIVGLICLDRALPRGEQLHKRQRKDWIAMWETLSDDYICTYDYDKDLLTIPEKSRWQKNGERYIRNYVRGIHQRKTLHPNDLKGFLMNVVESSMSEGKVLTYEFRSRLFGQHYEWFRLYYTSCEKEHSPGRMLVGRLVNIDEEKRSNSMLGSRSDVDARTGLLSEAAFYDTLEYYLLREGKQSKHAFFKVRLENFSQIQERFGYLFADVVIDSFASYMKGAFRKTDLLGRGGENVFFILMKDITVEEVEDRAKEVCAAFTKTYIIGPSEIGVGSNIGIAFYPADGVVGEALCGKADRALLRAKEQGHNHYAFFRDAEEVALQEAVQGVSFAKQKVWQYDKALLTYAVQVISMCKDTESAMSSTMERVGRHFNLDKIVVVMKKASGERSFIFHLWQNITQGDAREWRDIVFSPRETAAIFAKLETQSQMIAEEGVDFAAEDSGKSFFTQFKVKSMVGCAIASDQHVEGFIGFIAVSAGRQWTGIELDTMWELTNLLVPVITMNKEKKEQKQLLLQMIASAEEANKAKSRFLSHMSHEIRTPLNAIIGMTAIAQNCAADTPKVKECIRKIEHSSAYLLGIVNNILDMSKIENGEMKLSYELFSLTELVSNVRELMYSQAEIKQIDFQVVNKAKEYQLKGDKTRLLEILINIISNAVKFTKHGGFVRLAIEERHVDKTQVILKFEISDNGIGMEEEFQAQIFKPFAQVQQDNIATGKGTGLGMAICKNLVELMQGTIQMCSKPGEGTVFTVEVPFDMSIRQDGAEEEALIAVDLACLSGKKVLLVEDNEINLEIAKTMLEMNALVVETAADGQEAAACFSKQAVGYFDAILMDINMPVMNGMEATRTIRGMDRPDAKTVKIIAMTANVFQEDIVKALASGMNDYLSKPVDMEKLFYVLHKNVICSVPTGEE